MPKKKIPKAKKRIRPFKKRTSSTLIDMSTFPR